MMHRCERRRFQIIIRSILIRVVLLAAIVSIGCQAFTCSSSDRILARKSFSQRRQQQQQWRRRRRRRNSLNCYEETTILSLFDKRNESDDEGEIELPLLLGPAGSSSFIEDEDDGATSPQISTDLSPDTTATAAATTATVNNNKNTVQAFVNPKFALQYTCNVCDHTNRVIVSRKAYRKGMVIAVCKGCESMHWIADNLDKTLPDNNIEEYFESRGLGDTVNRVTKEVYEIERVWGFEGGENTDDEPGDDTALEY